MGEVLHELLPAVHDRVGQIARLVLCRAPRTKLSIVGLARCWQLVEGYEAHDIAVVPKAHVVPRIAFLVVGLTSAFGAVRLATHHSYIGDGLRRADEGRHVVR